MFKIDKDKLGDYFLYGFFVLMIIYGIVYQYNFHKDGVLYTIGKVFETEKTGDNYLYKYKYKINKKEYFLKYSGTGSANGNKNNNIYVVVMKFKHKKANVIWDYYVPPCLRYEDAPVNGWEQLPDKNICDSLANKK